MLGSTEYEELSWLLQELQRRIWAVEKGFGMRCDSQAQTSLTCLAEHQVQCTFQA